jgi:hypothetical protein
MSSSDWSQDARVMRAAVQAKLMIAIFFIRQSD